VTLTVGDVEHIAELAKLELTAEEKELFRLQLSAVLEHATRLAEVDTSTVPPTATVQQLQNVLRADLVTPSLSQEETLANAPDQLDGCFRVLPILE
jgi:aspartyl-tRNA(Asn)/glutamyl-tRNA(Gln) amidotransferase subunit C